MGSEENREAQRVEKWNEQGSEESREVNRPQIAAELLDPGDVKTVGQ